MSKMSNLAINVENGVPEKPLSIKELAQYFRVHPQSAWRWVNEGKIKAFKVGGIGHWRIHQAEISRLMKLKNLPVRRQQN